MWAKLRKKLPWRCSGCGEKLKGKACPDYCYDWLLMDFAKGKRKSVAVPVDRTRRGLLRLPGRVAGRSKKDASNLSLSGVHRPVRTWDTHR